MGTQCSSQCVFAQISRAEEVLVQTCPAERDLGEGCLFGGGHRTSLAVNAQWLPSSASWQQAVQRQAADHSDSASEYDGEPVELIVRALSGNVILQDAAPSRALVSWVIQKVCKKLGCRTDCVQLISGTSILDAGSRLDDKINLPCSQPVELTYMRLRGPAVGVVQSTSGRGIQVLDGVPKVGSKCHFDRHYHFTSLGGFAEIKGMQYIMTSNDDKRIDHKQVMWRIEIRRPVIVYLNFRSQRHVQICIKWLAQAGWDQSNIRSTVSTGVPNGPYSGPVYSKAVDEGVLELMGSNCDEGTYFVFVGPIEEEQEHDDQLSNSRSSTSVGLRSASTPSFSGSPWLPLRIASVSDVGTVSDTFSPVLGLEDVDYVKSGLVQEEHYYLTEFGDPVERGLAQELNYLTEVDLVHVGGCGCAADLNEDLESINSSSCEVGEEENLAQLNHKDVDGDTCHVEILDAASEDIEKLEISVSAATLIIQGDLNQHDEHEVGNPTVVAEEHETLPIPLEVEKVAAASTRRTSPSTAPSLLVRFASKLSVCTLCCPR